MFEYKIYTSDNCPEELFRFRYSIYVEEMHRKQHYACHETKTIKDYLDSTANQVVAHKDGEIVGCIRANLLRKGPVGDYHTLYELDKLPADEIPRASICTRLMISKKYRKTPLSADIFKALYVFGVSNNILTSYIDCNRHLVGFFEKFGYEYLFNKTHDEYGDVAVMRLKLFEFDRLIAINSPFAEICRDFVDPPALVSA